MPDMMGDAVADTPAHQDPLDLRMTVKDSGGPRPLPLPLPLPDSPYTAQSSSRLSGGSPDSDRSLPDSQMERQPPTPTSYSLDRKFPVKTSPSTVTGEAGLLEERGGGKDPTDTGLDFAKNGATAGTPLRPFKMYPHMDPLMYGSMLGGSVGSMSSPGGLGSMGLSSLYDTPTSVASPSGGAFGLGVTPMVSYVMQKRRRHEAREKENKDREQSASRSPPATTTTTSSASFDDDDDPDDKKLKLMPDEKKDEAYWERRRKNNEAAKRSRDARRQKEEEIAMRAAFLEQENLKLRAQVAILKNETAKLHYLLYNRV